jgi:hypothetical protein
MLSPPDEECRWVQFEHELTKADYQTLGEWLTDYPELTLTTTCYDGSITNLDFLEHFPKLRRFQSNAVVDSLTNIEGLGHLPADLVDLGLGATRKKLSLAPLARFTQLRSLDLEGHTKDIDAVSALVGLKRLALRSITLPDLSILLPLTELEAFELRLGHTSNLALLPRIGKLRYVELWMIRDLADLTPLAGTITLEALYLQGLGQVDELPNLGLLQRLRSIHLLGLKNLNDVSALLTAPALERLSIFDMPHLTPTHLAPLAQHPTLSYFSASLGNDRKNDAVEDLIPLPPNDSSGRLDWLGDPSR